jgi:hypothetical protein
MIRRICVRVGLTLAALWPAPLQHLGGAAPGVIWGGCLHWWVSCLQPLFVILILSSVSGLTRFAELIPHRCSCGGRGGRAVRPPAWRRQRGGAAHAAGAMQCNGFPPANSLLHPCSHHTHICSALATLHAACFEANCPNTPPTTPHPPRPLCLCCAAHWPRGQRRILPGGRQEPQGAHVWLWA